jgi:hypothetical protein
MQAARRSPKSWFSDVPYRTLETPESGSTNYILQRREPQPDMAKFTADCDPRHTALLDAQAQQRFLQ